ncbi:hypothetical protein B296_00031295 [Ensete ventricosum]|uniref:Uncharacterized protein n=1 Tax=Ensete ventricosum TaxID=4639 RepID=A0A426XR86_ENSVE|nr:hypothetical protein B296_00031295 [Ensete ventricosum]
MVPQRWDFRGVIDPLLSWRESVGRKRGQGGRECNDKLQVPRQGGRVEAKELHKIGVNGLLIKIAESEGLRVDAGVLDQERSRQYMLLYLFYLEEYVTKMMEKTV